MITKKIKKQFFDLIKRGAYNEYEEQYYCAKFFDPDLHLESWSLLHWACAYGNIKMVDSLLKDQSDIEAKDEDGETPLYCAISHDNYDFVALLIAQGANLAHQNDCKETPLHVAARTYAAANILELLLCMPLDSRAKDQDGRTPLHVAVMEGHFDLTWTLLAYHADTEAKDDLGMRPLHWAACYGDHRAVKLLLDHGAKTAVWDKDGQTPLQLAQENKRHKVVETLLHYGEKAPKHLN